MSALAERGFDVDLLDQCLSHTRKGVFGIYQRASRMADRERALSTWANLVTGEEARNVSSASSPEHLICDGWSPGARRTRRTKRTKFADVAWPGTRWPARRSSSSGVGPPYNWAGLPTPF